MLFPLWPPGPAQGSLEYRDLVQQGGDESDRRVVQGEAGAQALDPGDGAELAGREPQAAARVPGCVEDPQGDEPADQIRVHARGGGEFVQVHPRGADEGVGHRGLLGSKSDTAANRSNASCSALVGLAGTMILVSAYRSPGLPLGLGSPRPGSRSSTCRSRPSSRYTGSGAITAIRYRSPGGAPSLPRPPWPASRIRCPSVTPGGIVTSSVLVPPGPAREMVRRVP